MVLVRLEYLLYNFIITKQLRFILLFVVSHIVYCTCFQQVGFDV